MKHCVSAEEISKEDLESIFSLTDRIKAKPAKFFGALRGKVVAALFYEPSTRTRLSFESAALRLGAGVISAENARENTSGSKGESLEDTVRITRGYADAIVLRHYDDDSARRAAAVAGVPVINAGSGGAEHPTQSLLDAYTLKEYKGRLGGLKIALMGDLKYGRTAHSLIKILSKYDGVKFFGYCVKGLELPAEYADKVDYTACKSFENLPADADAVYQTRVQRERLKETGDFEAFVLDKRRFSFFGADTLLMHPLPRVNELSPDLDGDPRSVYFKQAENGLFVRMALLKLLIKN